MSSDDEIVDLIVNLLTIYAPDSLDKRMVLERVSVKPWLIKNQESGKCSKCGKTMTCLRCSTVDISYDVEVTVKVDGEVFYG